MTYEKAIEQIKTLGYSPEKVNTMTDFRTDNKSMRRDAFNNAIDSISENEKILYAQADDQSTVILTDAQVVYSYVKTIGHGTMGSLLSPKMFNNYVCKNIKYSNITSMSTEMISSPWVGGDCWFTLKIKDGDTIKFHSSTFLVGFSGFVTMRKTENLSNIETIKSILNNKIK